MRILARWWSKGEAEPATAGKIKASVGGREGDSKEGEFVRTKCERAYKKDVIRDREKGNARGKTKKTKEANDVRAGHKIGSG